MAAPRAMLTAGLVAIPDVLEDAEYVHRAEIASEDGLPERSRGPAGARSQADRRHRRGRPEAGPFPREAVALLQTFASQAVIAIENVRLFTELEARTKELTRSVGELEALGEVGQAVSSTIDLETVLRHDRVARADAHRNRRRRRLRVRRDAARNSSCARPTT